MCAHIKMSKGLNYNSNSILSSEKNNETSKSPDKIMK